MSENFSIFAEDLKLKQIEREHIVQRMRYRVFLNKCAEEKFWGEKLERRFLCDETRCRRSDTLQENGLCDIQFSHIQISEWTDVPSYIETISLFIENVLLGTQFRKLSLHGTIIAHIPLPKRSITTSANNDVEKLLDVLRNESADIAARHARTNLSVRITPYASSSNPISDEVTGFYLCVEHCSTEALLCRVAGSLGVDPCFSHNSLMYLNQRLGRFEEQGTTINVSIDPDGFGRGQMTVCSKAEYTKQLAYYANLFNEWKDFLSSSISYLVSVLNFDATVIRREDIGDEYIADIEQKLSSFEKRTKTDFEYTESSSLSAYYQDILPSQNSVIPRKEQLKRSCALLMVLLDRIKVRLYGIYIDRINIGATAKCELLYMHFDIAPQGCREHKRIALNDFLDSTSYLMAQYLHRSQDRLSHYLRRSVTAACHSAIGSIMSRNGSHNIGSHVLAALSHNIGTMPDDRVLYQYIQHRMDYIATATTDRPQWRQPTMFVTCLMKEFLKQKHLLDHISGSEGLHAYKFQWQTRVIEHNKESEAQEDEHRNTIRVHIRRICPDATHATRDSAWEKDCFFGDSGIVDFIDYDKSEMRNLPFDLSMAIPGGVIGHHAFYTIIENILRNAAKHEWAEAMRVWKIAKLETVLGEDRCCKEFLDCRPRYLDLYIDFRDNPYSGKVECRIWNDRVISAANTARIRTAILQSFIAHVADVGGREKLGAAVKILLNWHQLFCKQRMDLKENSLFKLIERCRSCIIDEKGKPLSDEKLQAAIVEGLIAGTPSLKDSLVINDQSIREFIYEAIKLEDLELERDLTNKIGIPFIDEKTGGLRKENWGIAEMRISAGFLQCRNTAHIGGLADADSPLTIIRPVLVENQNHDKCVAYRFDVDKPRLLLVVLNSPCNNLVEINANASRCGVKFMMYEDLRAGDPYPYSYILFEHLDDAITAKLKSREIMLPFRNLCASSEKDDAVFSDFVPKYTGAFFDKSADINTLEWLIQHPDGTEDVCYALLESVYADWMRHVLSHGLPRENGWPKIVLDVGDETSMSGSAQTLISKFELLKFVFEHTFNAAIRSFLKENGPAAGTGSLEKIEKRDSVGAGRSVIDSFGYEVRNSGEIVSLPRKVAAVLLSIAQLKHRTIATEKQLAAELRISEQTLLSCPADVVEAQLRLWIRRDVLGQNSCVKVVLDDSDPELKDIWGFNKSDKAEKIGSLQSLLDDDLCLYWLSRFVNYIATVALDQADSFLRKYEERFATLPGMPKTDEMVSRDMRFVPMLKIGDNVLQEIILTSDSEVRVDALMARDICYFRHGTDLQTTIGDLYYEPLSGAQSTMNAFMSFRQDLADVSVELSATQKKDVHCRAAGFAAQLVENASFRILIVDERVKKFMNDHSEVSEVLKGLRIAVADDTDPEVIQMFSADFDKIPPKFSGVELTRFEIVIIHQGVIDKLLSGHDDKRVVEAWMNRLIEKLHYVVITTGRGSPANIPDSARVLPYSVIESSILQRFPEKMILVDAVMNILPVRQQEEEENG